MMKKLICLLLGITLLTGLFLPADAESQSIASGGGTGGAWELTADGTLTFSGNYILHYADQTKDPWYPYLQQITRVVIGGTIDKIPADAFCNYPQLEAVEVAHSLSVSIGDDAFSNCVALKYVDLGSNVKEIGASAFYGCSSLETVFLPPFSYPYSIGDHAFSCCEKLRQISIPGEVTLGSYVFVGCPELTAVYINESSSLYGFKAEEDSFYGVTAHVLYPPYDYPAQYLMKDYGGELTWTEATEGVCGAAARWHYDAVQKLLTVTGTGSLFSYISGHETPWGSFHDEILKIRVENGITQIPSYSFEYCKSATEVVLPETLISIDLNAFNDCTALNNLLLPATLRSIGDSRFNYTYSFIRCPSLTDVYYLGTEEEWLGITNADKVENLEVEMIMHFLTPHSKAPTCTENGIATYFTFEEGSAYPGLYDEEKKPIFQPVAVPALGHRYQSGLCTHCGEAEPGVTLSGTVNQDMTLELWNKTGDRMICTVTAADGKYTLENVTPGSYLLKATKPGYVTRMYPLTAETEAAAPAVTICRAGDVTGDGKINVLDVSRLYAHVRGTDPLEGYGLSCADLNGDGRCNILDAARAYTHVRGADILY